jgi:hypothetical protein
MSHRAFKKITMLEIQIAGNYSKCGTTSEPMIPEIVVAIGL